MSIDTLNLIYHITPFEDARPTWMANLKQLGQRINIFNGKRIAAIATGPEIAPFEELRSLLRESTEVIEVANDPRLRERVSFMQLLEKVHSVDPKEATFYAHAKGVRSRGNSEGIMYWRNMMYHELLDDPGRIKHLLDNHALVGTHRRQNHPMPDRAQGNTANWHYSGTFFWFRNRDWFSRPNWRKIPATGWAVEGAPGFLFPVNSGACLVKDGIADPYNPASYSFRERIYDDPAARGILLQIGEGTNLKSGFELLDITDNAHHTYNVCELTLGRRLPFAADSVVEVYFSHVMEIVPDMCVFLHELARICRVDANIEMRTVHWLHNMAGCYGHRQIISHEQVDHWTRTAVKHWWQGSSKRLQLIGQELTPGSSYHRWKALLPKASNQDIMELCPDAAREVSWKFKVIPNT